MTSVLVKAILIEIKERWQRANFKFKCPVIVQDITKCRCPLYDCEDDEVVCTGCHCQEDGCTGCPKNVPDLPPCHIVCTCLANSKMPLLELSFIRAQRAKVGSKSQAMIVNADEKESRKQIKSAQNKTEKKQRHKNKQRKN